MTSTPHLINLPPPPSDPATPSEIPGTPNSGTTVMSELSTVAIKDGHHGQPHHQSRQRYNPAHTASSDDSALEAERADRISRLAGLERVSTVRQASNASLPPGASAAHPQGYFDPQTGPSMLKERSTVGSASATGSVGGRTTWTGTSDAGGETTDTMSEDQDMDTSSVGGFSESNASLVGFGEGAGSTVSGPISSLPQGLRQAQRGPLSSRAGVGPTTSLGARDPRHIDGMTYDQGVTDTSHAPAEPRDVAMSDRHSDD